MDKKRAFVLTDINASKLPFTERDDIQSLIRLLLYANEIDIEGIVLCTSCFLKNNRDNSGLKLVHEILEDYGKVLPKLEENASGFPSVEYLKKRVCYGIRKFGDKEGDGFASEKWNENEGVLLLKEAILKKEERPLWILLWGGANTLAQALWCLEKEKSEEEFREILHRLRVYTISDQDLSSSWIKEKYGKDLFLISDDSGGDVSGKNDYCHAVWPGISGDHFTHGSEDGVHQHGFQGADWDSVSPSWLKKNIQQGPFGRHYPDTVYQMEGDTPTYLGLIPNGLNDYEHPEYGGWGGRYKKRPKNEKRYVGDKDSVMGNDGKIHISPQATIWRWRTEFQNDFASRMDWTYKEKEECCHAPEVRVKEVPSLVFVGDSVTLDASESMSPDNSPLSFEWFIYEEVGNGGKAELSKADTSSVQVKFTQEGTLHLILKLSSLGQRKLTRYHRFIFNIKSVNK